MELKTLVVSPFEVNCYLYWDKNSGDGVVIDPGDSGDHIIAQVEAAGFTPKAILLTHGHGDHIAAVEEVRNHFQVPLYCGKGEDELLRNPSANVSALIGRPIVVGDPDKTLDDDDLVKLGTVELRVMTTPGHSPGGVCYLDERAGILFTGDTLFAGSIGRTDLPGGSMQVLLQSIKAKILPLPGSVLCYPGHGPSTTVENESKSNPFLIGDYFA